MYDLAVCKEAVDVIEYEADMDLGTYIKDALPRTFYQVGTMNKLINNNKET